jgi:tRNA dimethylallyltransferase
MQSARQAERAVLIAGPTASGKSALALAIAEAAGGMIVNADSMQVYRDLRILTARPTPEEEARMPHRLYGHVDAAETYSVGRWLREIEPVLAEASRLGFIPIVTGGTGLYFKALTRGLAAIPPIPPDVRASLRLRLAETGAPALHAELAQSDPDSAARIRPGDAVRIVRALEVFDATGRPLSEWHRPGMRPLVDLRDTVAVFLDVDRGELRRRIETRFDAMMAAGALEEARTLAARGLDPLNPVMKAHGMPWLAEAIAGRMPLEAAIAEAKADTKRYTKRQFTWFRHQLPEFAWVSDTAAQAHVLRELGCS